MWLRQIVYAFGVFVTNFFVFNEFFKSLIGGLVVIWKTYLFISYFWMEFTWKVANQNDEELLAEICMLKLHIICLSKFSDCATLITKNYFFLSFLVICNNVEGLWKLYCLLFIVLRLLYYFVVIIVRNAFNSAFFYWNEPPRKRMITSIYILFSPNHGWSHPLK